MTLRPWFTAALFATFTLLAGCAAPTPSDYASERPVLSLREYFNGRIDAHGMFQDRAGKVVKRFTVVMDCTWNGNDGTLDERFTFSDGSTQRRVWKLTALPDGRFTGTAGDVVGIAHGQQQGNAFHWNYTLKQPVGNTVYEVQMDDWMFLVDGQVMLNRAEMSKFGITVGTVTLSFVKKP